MEDMSLEELFAAADAIEDHRTEAEKAEVQRELREAIAVLGEVIGE
jgi:hypothetical protein